MPTYRLRCVLYFHDGRAGCAIDSREIEAESPIDPIALAMLYVFPNPRMSLLAASLSAPTGVLIWSLRSEVPPRIDFKPKEG